jgi:hypothetical protein
MSRRPVQLCLMMLILLLAPRTGAEEVHTPRPPEAFTAEVPVAWFDLLYAAVVTEQFSPPQASRVYGGIRYPVDSANGLVQGRCIGETILDRVQFQTWGRHRDDGFVNLLPILPNP